MVCFDRIKVEQLLSEAAAKDAAHADALDALEVTSSDTNIAS